MISHSYKLPSTSGWEVVPYTGTFLQPFHGLRAGPAAVSLLCQMPQNRLAIVSWSDLPEAPLDHLVLLREGSALDDALYRLEADLFEWATQMRLPAPSLVATDELTLLTKQVLDRTTLERSWLRWRAGSEEQGLLWQIDNSSWGSTTTAYAAAEAVFKAHLSKEAGDPFTEQVLHAMKQGRIEFVGQVPAAARVVTAHILGMLCELFPDGALDILDQAADNKYTNSSFMQEHLLNFPRGVVEKWQTAIDDSFRGATAPCPVRYPVANMAQGLYLRCAASLFNWVEETAYA